MTIPERDYWDRLTDDYQSLTHISVDDFHYGPLIPGDAELQLLPHDLRNLDCLELGCGAAQNSICLARQGACCTAFDISGEQLKTAAKIAREHRVQINLLQGNLDNLPFHSKDRFDLIHSSFALPFAQFPEQVIRSVANLLRPGGTLLFSTAHPLSNGEWLEVDKAETGVFLENYFETGEDYRELDNNISSSSRSFPVSTVFNWLTNAGLVVEKLLEPAPYASAGKVKQLAPYWSEDWLEQREALCRIPFLLIFRARKPFESS